MTTHVFRIPPLLKILRAIPNEVGPNTAPAAITCFVSVIPKRYVMSIPRPIGKILPKKAIKQPRVPITLSVLKSISIPASMTRKIKLQEFRQIP
jgi:hypothetical protein